MKTVYLTSACSEFQANLLKETLSNNGIEYSITNEYMSGLMPNCSNFEMDFYVLEKDYELAMKLLKDDFPEL